MPWNTLSIGKEGNPAIGDRADSPEELGYVTLAPEGKTDTAGVHLHGLLEVSKLQKQGEACDMTGGGRIWGAALPPLPARKFQVQGVSQLWRSAGSRHACR